MNNEKTLSVEFTKSQVDNLVEFIEWNFIDIIRKDEEVDNINYIIDMMEALKKLRAVAEKFDNEPIKEQVYQGGKQLMKIIKNPDQELVQEIEQRKKENDGYCPCSLEKTPDTKCMCKEFRDMTEGMCHCGLYIKVVE